MLERAKEVENYSLFLEIRRLGGLRIAFARLLTDRTRTIS